MNESAIRTEEQIISLFPDRETQICRSSMGGWAFADSIFTAAIRKNSLQIKSQAEICEL